MRRARGFSMLDLGVALMLIMVAICIVGSALAQSTAHERILQRRLAAREGVMIGLERVRSMESSSLPKAGETLGFPLPPESARRLPKTTGRLIISSVDGEPALLRVRIEVSIRGTKEVESGEVLLRTSASPEAKP